METGEKTVMEEKLDYNMKLPMTDARYRIPGTDLFNMSAWSRDNEPKEPARFKVGDVIAVTIVAEVTRVYADVDGTPLYSIDFRGNGLSDDGSIRLATEEEANSF